MKSFLRKILTYLKLMRIKHWIKNVLVLAPLVFSGLLLNGDKFRDAVIGFFAFSFLASAAYIYNDICDAEKDRLHKTKKDRPIASGEVSSKEGAALIVLSILIAVALNYLTGEPRISFLWLGVYAFLSILYSRWLKSVPLLDVFILVLGFLIRLGYGGAVAEIQISGELYIAVIMASFYMGLGKRRNELGKDDKQIATRKVLKHYSYSFLDKNMYMCLGLAEGFYALWAIKSENRVMLWTVPMIIMIGMKYSLNIERDSDGDPVEVILHDKVIVALLIIYAVIILTALYK